MTRRSHHAMIWAKNFQDTEESLCSGSWVGRSRKTCECGKDDRKKAQKDWQTLAFGKESEVK